MSPKQSIRPNGDTRRTMSQGSGLLATPLEVDDSIAPIFSKHKKEVIMEHMRISQSKR